MHILGLDFATKTGVAYGSAGAPAAQVQTETWALPAGGGDEVGAILHAFRARLMDRLVRGVEVVVMEAPFEARHTDHRGRLAAAPNQTRRSYGAAGIIEEACVCRGVRCIEVVTSTLKKNFAGHGRAQKPDMIRAAKRRGFNVINDHEADACGLWLEGVRLFAPEFAHLYDPLFARGGQ